MTCSTNSPWACCISHGPGVADRNTICPTRSRNSSNRNGRLSAALGSRNPCSIRIRLRDASPSYIPPICGIVWWDSSITVMKSSGK